MENKKKKIITIPIIILSFVSLFTDIASEMLYPVTPIFLTSYLGASMAILGLIEGIAESIAGLSKGYFGILSDRLQRRKIFVVLGYSISALLKPLPGVWQSFAGVLTARVGDRMGKGIRTAPRDALLSSYSTIENRGAVFGFHRAMDTLGAAIGPLLALIFLYFYPEHYKEIFLIAFIPSIIAVVFSLFIKEDVQIKPSQKQSLILSFKFWKDAPKEYKQLICITTFFALFNSSDVFLIMRAREVVQNSGIERSSSDIYAIVGYIFYNFVYAFASYPIGILSDKIGKKKVFSLGLFLFSITYFGFALSHSVLFLWILFALYGIYAASTEGILKAWISVLVEQKNLASAIGLQTALTSLSFIFASFFTGLLWSLTNSSIALFITSLAGFITFIMIYKIKTKIN